MGRRSGDTRAAESRRQQGKKASFEIFGGKARANRDRRRDKTTHLAAHRVGSGQRIARRSKGCDARFACSVVGLCVFIAVMLFAYFQLVHELADGAPS